MDNSVRRKINEIAEAIINSLEIEIPINNIENIIQDLNGKLIRKDYITQGAEGVIYREEDGFVIEMPKVNKEKDNFTIAHELGHLFLHMGYLIDEDKWNRNKEKVYLRKEVGEKEYQANEFALALLMPRTDFFDKMIENYNGDGTYNMDKVAEYFNVPVDKAINRGRWLGILQWIQG